MLVREILHQLDLGNPVAEFDKGLSNYFLVTDAFSKIVDDKADMITGDKGTGKTAIYQYLQQYKNTNPLMSNVHIIAGINPSGEPLFRRFGEEITLSEGQYVTIWKLYYLSLIGNWVIKNFPKTSSKHYLELEMLLSKIGLLSKDDSAGIVFPRLMGWLRDRVHTTTMGIDITINEYGIPIYSPKIEFGVNENKKTYTGKDVSEENMISHHDAYQLLETVLKEIGAQVWVIMDRLDESFIGRPDIEIPALRALIRSFMDITAYPHIRLKLFVRSDLFRKMTQDGFANLTHVNARRTEIIWDDDDLMDLLCQRIRKNNHELLRSIGVSRLGNIHLFQTLFPVKFDPNQRQLTWKWMLSQIRDGNGVKAPRNLIDLCILSQEVQLRKERRAAREYESGIPLIDSDSIKKASMQLSELRLQDTLLAEYARDVKVLINAFRNRKAEHNDQSLAEMFHVDIEQARLYARALMDIGFFESLGDTYKIPFLYRAGLNITQGKAFNGNSVNHKN